MQGEPKASKFVQETHGQEGNPKSNLQKRKRRPHEIQNQQQTSQNGGQQQRKALQETQIPPKPEKLDKEIEEIAKQIREANEKKMIQLKSFPLFHTNQTIPLISTADILSEDWTSVQGQFGWAELAKTIIPYLTRSGEKYVSLRMADSKIFLKYKQLFTEEIRSCFKFDRLQVTKAEAQLLNEINFRHCDNFFGRLEFTVNDGIVTLKEITEMYDFLDFCYFKLIEKNPAPHKRCGFIRIASQNCVPYVWHENVQYVPLFYFEGECKYLEERSKELRGWDLAYLKLACKIQGIRKALFDEDSIRVVELELLKKFFPADTLFEDIWPTEYSTETLIQKPLPRLVSIEINDHRKKAPPVVDSNQVVAVQKRPMPMKTTFQKVPATVVERSLSAPSTGGRNTITTVRKNLKPLPPQHSYRNNRPTQTIPNAYHLPNQQNTYINQYINSITNTSTTSSANLSGNTLTNSTVPNLMDYQRTALPHTSHKEINITSMAYKQTPTLRQVPLSNVNAGAHVLQIPDYICNNSGCPYFLVKAQVENKMFNSCLNMEPYVTTTLLISLEEISMMFFEIPIDLVLNAAFVMRLNIFFPNKLQIRALERAERYPTRGLLKIKDFIDHLPQIRYILSHFN